MPNVVLMTDTLVNGTACRKVSVTPAEGRVDLDFMQAQGKYTTISLSPADLAQLIWAIGQAGGEESAGPKFLVE